MKDWTFEEVKTAQAAYVDAGGDPDSLSAPLVQWALQQQLAHHLSVMDKLQADFEAGNDFALLRAVADCLGNDQVAPDWVVRGFLKRYNMVTDYEVKTLDEAFGTYLPKNAKFPAKQQMREKSRQAYDEVKRRHESGESIDVALFTKVGESMYLSPSKVRDYFYLWQHIFEDLESKFEIENNQTKNSKKTPE